MANVVGTSADPNTPAVSGNQANGGIAVFGVASLNGRGVVGVADLATAVEGNSTGGAGVWGSSKTGEGVHGETNSPTVAAIAAFNLNPNGTGAAVFGQKIGNNGHAGFFDGNVHVTRSLLVEGDITLPNAGDFAEDFCVAEYQVAEPGTVMVLCDDEMLRPSDKPYDKRVAGVVSGAGAYKPAIILDRQKETIDRKPLALVGKVYCKVDARYAPIEVGDLLTTSATVGHAMKATDSTCAFGTVIGKALRALHEGQAMIPILIALQ
jgi:hypothetical protein